MKPDDLGSASAGRSIPLVSLDPWLSPYEGRIRERISRYEQRRRSIDEHGGLLGPVSLAHDHFGFTRGHHNGEAGVWYREWAPGAHALSLLGDFNHWNRGATPLKSEGNGEWSVFLPDSIYRDTFTHGSRVKVHVRSALGGHDRIPTFCRRLAYEGEPPHYVGQYWNPPVPYQWKHPSPLRHRAPRIYEAHVGMALEEGKVGTFREFTEQVLPRIADLHYNTIQLMAVMEHPYYASFGYHVSNFFAVTSRFGDPDDLKALIDAAHGMGLAVIMDLVHSHCVKNVLEGLNLFDGTEYQYFHAGARREHPAWDSLCFDYAKPQVINFLLSNVRFWLQEYRFDGFRFDGVTSMLYHDHGMGSGFSSYDDYFSGNVDEDAVTYLMLANEVIHEIRPDAMSIAEDVSGMPGLARRVSEGGLGFDYRLAMGLPDYWVKVLEKRDEEWSIHEMYHALLNRRAHEHHIAYVESHDQALVGDKTLSFRLMDAEMYWHMNTGSTSLVIDRGIALHKLIRLITFSLGGEGYLNFMGNEFGHPEWIDFPREGNGYSYHHARRQWSLADNELLRYRGLNEFDRALQLLDERFDLLRAWPIDQMMAHDEAKTLAYMRGDNLLFIYNFHPEASYSALRVPVKGNRSFEVVLDTDDARFGGFGRTRGVVYPYQPVPMYGREGSIEIYLPSRCAQVLKVVEPSH